MKIDFKRSVYVLAIFSALFFAGCGTGDTKPKAPVDTDNDPTTGPIVTPSDPDKINFKYNRITIAGSSITWGKGNMGEGSYLGEVEKYLRDDVATTLIPDEGEEISDPMAYKGKLYRYSAGTNISGTLEGDKISVVFAKERGSAGAKVELWVDGVLQEGVLDTKGEEVKSFTKNFSANGSTKSFDLGMAHTFDHSVGGYGGGFINTAGYGEFTFGSYSWAIIRKEVEDRVHHFITFKDAPSSNFSVSYKYGKNIKPVKSSVDNTQQNIGTAIESTYGEWSSTSLSEDLNPKRGLDFRQTDISAVKTWNLDSYGDHNFTLKVTDGELLLNFITNHMYFFQNAGIGGAEARFLYKRYNNARTTEQIIDFKPDLFILESSTNDQKNGGTNEWIEARDNRVFTLPSSNKIELASPLSSVKAGDVVVMGEYNGNINSVAAGVVSAVNGAVLTLREDVPSHITKVYKIKRISEWEDNVKGVIAEVTNGVSHNVKVGIATCGVPNLSERQLMGYTEKGKIMASKEGWMFFDFFQKTLEVEPGIDVDKVWSFGDNTHPNANGNILFGEAIKEVLSKN